MKLFRIALCMLASLPAALSAHDPYPVVTLPDCLRLCPAGDICQPIQVKDSNNNPIVGAEMRIIFGAGADQNIHWCPGQPHPVISGMTDFNGEWTVCVRAGGCHPWEGPGQPPQNYPCCVVIEVDPGAIAIGVYHDIGSPDCHTDLGAPPNGDGDVDLLDFVVFAQLFDSTHHCGDYHDDTPEGDGECDEDVDLLDFVVFAQHFDHRCE